MAVSLNHPDQFRNRHIGPEEHELKEMLAFLGVASLDELIDQTVPRGIRMNRPLRLSPAVSESAVLEELAAIARKNQIFKSYIGMGYSDTITPKVILRNILENPGWYTQYTPYQAEISQGRLEALLNYQTMVMDLTGMEVANASMLDEATAAAEGMNLCINARGETGRAFFVSQECHPQTIDVVKTRGDALGVSVVVGDHRTFDFSQKICGALVQYPASDGAIYDYRGFAEKVHEAGGLLVVAADILSLALLTPPGEFGADVAVGSTQRFGVPMGFGGPHAAYFATKNAYTRVMPGRLIGVSEDAQGRPALRMALQTREQHIRREKATSNICTAQVLLAVMASMYAVYHGPKGVKAIAEYVHGLTALLVKGLGRVGIKVKHEGFFDTVRIEAPAEKVTAFHAAAEKAKINLRRIDATSIGISLDEATSPRDVEALLGVFDARTHASELAADVTTAVPEFARRKSAYLTHPVFNTHHSETEMLRYISTLQSRDLSLAQSMIPLGSCTMKLNATAEMIPVTWPEFGKIHPFAPKSQVSGYLDLFASLETMLSEITGFAATSLQPNAGSQGEYAGLLVIRRYHESRGQKQRDICLIPSSAHGTNPASAVMAGFKVVVTRCEENGNIDLADLKAKAEEHKDRLAALMVTYPSTHGVFEEDIKEICEVIHGHGGQVYMDGANMNAQVGLCRPGDVGADVCHLNLHKTFCIPHGGGGPGMGPICVAAHLAPFLPNHPVVEMGGQKGVGAISAAPWGSASILVISYAYIRMMGPDGLTDATRYAILNANYIARRLDPHYPVLYRGKKGRVAHECIIDVRQLKKTAGIEVEDVAKRLMDYGFHAPTVSFPVAGTLMIEPTESEPKTEMDRFCEAMIAIRAEIKEIEDGQAPKDKNLLKMAPHTARVVSAESWDRPYSRERAAFPTPHTRAAKFWPAVGRLNQVLGDRKLVCSCPAIEAYMEPGKAA